MVGKAISLREMSEIDVPAWFERLSDPVSSHLSGDPIPESIETCYEWLAGMREMFKSGESIRWAIEPKALGQSIGSIGIFDIKPELRSGEMGTVIHRSYWNKGFVTEAGHLVINYAFQTMGLTKIYADCLSENGASIRVLEKLGFSLAKTLPSYRTTDGVQIEGLLFVIEAHNNG